MKAYVVPETYSKRFTVSQDKYHTIDLSPQWLV